MDIERPGKPTKQSSVNSIYLSLSSSKIIILLPIFDRKLSDNAKFSCHTLTWPWDLGQKRARALENQNTDKINLNTFLLLKQNYELFIRHNQPKKTVVF